MVGINGMRVGDGKQGINKCWPNIETDYHSYPTGAGAHESTDINEMTTF